MKIIIIIVHENELYAIKLCIRCKKINYHYYRDEKCRHCPHRVHGRNYHHIHDISVNYYSRQMSRLKLKLYKWAKRITYAHIHAHSPAYIVLSRNSTLYNIERFLLSHHATKMQIMRKIIYSHLRGGK